MKGEDEEDEEEEERSNRKKIKMTKVRNCVCLGIGRFGCEMKRRSPKSIDGDGTRD